MSIAARGRPRDTNIDEKILTATIELLTTVGYEETTVEAVANQSGVSRPAIYRRFKNRTELVFHASDYVFNQLSPDVRRYSDSYDLVLALLENTVEQLTRTPAGALIRNLIPYFDREPGFAQHANTVGAKRRVRLKAAVEKAIADDLMERPHDVDIWIDRVLGAIYFRYLIVGRSLNKSYINNLIS